MILECKSLVKYYGRKKVIDNVELSLEENSIIGLLGPNGAGKSTLLKMITGLVWPTYGNINMCGYDVHYEHEYAMKEVGAIIEWPSFIPYLSARQNLKILSGGRGKEFEKKMSEVVEFVNMTSRLDDKVSTFSTGMKQRLGIALSLLPDSQFIILDEPANGLDPAGIAEIRRMLKEYNNKYGTTILLSSHLLGEVEQICDKIVILHRGKIVAAGSMSELLHSNSLIRIKSVNINKAADIIENALKEKFPILSISRTYDEILIEVNRNCAAEINTALVNNGIKVSHISFEPQSLEKYFMEITEGETDVT